ncbi:MAG: hypothetical protein ACI901_000657, partial [Octadecabacter sp.]
MKTSLTACQATGLKKAIHRLNQSVFPRLKSTMTRE